MSMDSVKETQEAFSKLIRAVQLKDIQLIEVHSSRSTIGVEPEPKEGEIELSWSQQFADDDPMRPEDAVVIFRPKYEVSFKKSGEEYFHVSLVIAIQLSLINKDDFNSSFENESVRKIFLETQIVKTMWPILRQQVLDIMSRHSLKPIPLPWMI